MVNVNKPISKDENMNKQMPKRRPRNTELNSSKKVAVSSKMRALARNRNTAKFNPSLNSSLNCTGGASGTGWWKDGEAYYAELNAKAIGEALKAAAENADAVTPQDDEYAWTYRYDSCFVRIEDIADCDVIVGPRDYDSVDKIKKGDFDNALCYIERFLGSAESVYCYAVGRDIVEAINQQAVDPYGMSYKTYSSSEQYSKTFNANSSCENSSKKLNCTGDEPGHMSNRPLTLDLLKKMRAVLSPGWGRQKSDAYVEECHESEKLDHPDYDENWLLHQHLWDYFNIHEEDLDKLPKHFTRDDVINIMEDPDMFRDNNVNSSKKLNCSDEDSTEGEPEFSYSASDVGMEGEEDTIAADLGIDSASIKKVRYSDDEYAKVYLTDGSTIIIADTSRDGHHKWADASSRFNSSKKLNCAAEDDVKITTESGNEVSLSDIQIIQNPSTNEISLFIKEDEDEEIPEGFTVIATAAQPALSDNGTCPKCGQDPCVCEGEEVEGEEIDSSKKKN